MSFQSLLNESHIIKRAGKTNDGQGGHIETLNPIAEVRGRIRPSSASEKKLGDRWDAIVTHVAYYRIGLDIQRNDRIFIGSDVYRVISRRPTSKPHHIEVDCEQIQVKNNV